MADVLASRKPTGDGSNSAKAHSLMKALSDPKWVRAVLGQSNGLEEHEMDDFMAQLEGRDVFDSGGSDDDDDDDDGDKNKVKDEEERGDSKGGSKRRKDRLGAGESRHITTQHTHSTHTAHNRP
jgi:hypothetical protein